MQVWYLSKQQEKTRKTNLKLQPWHKKQISFKFWLWTAEEPNVNNRVFWKSKFHVFTQAHQVTTQNAMAVMQELEHTYLTSGSVSSLDTRFAQQMVGEHSAWYLPWWSTHPPPDPPARVLLALDCSWSSWQHLDASRQKRWTRSPPRYGRALSNRRLPPENRRRLFRCTGLPFPSRRAGWSHIRWSPARSSGDKVVAGALGLKRFKQEVSISSDEIVNDVKSL